MEVRHCEYNYLQRVPHVLRSKPISTKKLHGSRFQGKIILRQNTKHKFFERGAQVR